MVPAELFRIVVGERRCMKSLSKGSVDGSCERDV
jgi:hypothetical protein